MTDYASARRNALKQAAEHIRDAMRDKSPSERIAAAWRVRTRGEDYQLFNGLISAVATNADFKHWSWGHKPVTPTNEKRPERTAWVSRAADESIDDAEEQFRGEYLQRIAATSKVFSVDNR